ncbi:MAG: hypothetical protein MUF08_09505 [Burkholderiaceae bacterium]|jgi:hypothetical protein|nr:hypothetical protein [Burkholderiaceae bacterium]
MKAMAWLTLSLAMMAPAAGATELASLIDLPVAGSVVVPPSQVRGMSSRAARSAGPVDIALRGAGAFEGKQQLIVQTNEGAESPTASRVTVIRDGLLDDAVRTERWDIDLARTGAGPWKIRQVNKSWRCWRGAPTAGFSAQPCP